MMTVIRLPEVLTRTGLSRSTIYAMISVGAFPKPVKLGLRAVGWPEAEVGDWLVSRLTIRDSVH